MQIQFVVAIVFGVQVNDRYWMPRPDQNFLSWGFGFLVISAIFALVSGILLYKEGQDTYNKLLRKEDEYTKQALEMSAYTMAEQQMMHYPPEYGAPEYSGPAYPAEQPSYEQKGLGYEPNYGPSTLPSSSHPSSYEKDPNYAEKDPDFSDKDAYPGMGYGAGSYADADRGDHGPNGGTKGFRSFERRPSYHDDEDDVGKGYPRYSGAYGSNA